MEERLAGNKSILVQNFLGLFSIQVLNYLIPLATTPYLTRVLGKEYYASNEYIVSLVGYFVVLIDFGFNISATKRISEKRNSQESLSRIASGILALKVLLMLVSVVVLLFLVDAVPAIGRLKLLVYFSIGSLAGAALFPLWYFLGLEKMKKVAVINIVCRALSAVAIFFIVKNETDFIYISLLNSVAGLASAFAAIYLMKKDGIDFILPRVKYIVALFKESSHFFLSRAAITLYVNTTVILLGTYVGFGELGLFNIAFKIMILSRTPFDILNSVVYPNMASTKNMDLLKKILLLAAVSSTLIYLVLFFGADLILWIIAGKEFVPADDVLRILCLILPLSAVHSLLGGSVLVVHNKSKYFTRSNILSAGLYFIAVAILFLTDNVSLISMAWILVLVDVFVFIYRAYYVRKFKFLTA